MIDTASRIEIRHAGPADLPRIAEIMESVSDRAHPVDNVRAMTGDLAPGEYYAWLAVSGDEPVGLTMLDRCVLVDGARQTSAGYWRYLWVRPDQRRTGLYPRLVFGMISAAANAGIDLIYAAIRRPDVAAGHLALGMQKVGEIPVLAKPINPAALFSKFHGLGTAFTGLSTVPDFVYRRYLSLRWPSSLPGRVIEDSPAVRIDISAVVPALRDRYSSKVQRLLTPESFLKRYSANSDGAEYRVLTVGTAKEVEAAIVYRTAVRGNNIQILAVLEMGFRNGHEDALRFALSALEKQAIDLRYEVILCLSNAPGIQAVLRQMGYLKSNETYVLIKKETRPQSGSLVSGNIDEWYFTFSDHDAF